MLQRKRVKRIRLFTRVNSCDVHSAYVWLFFFFQAEDGIRDLTVTGVQTCALPISLSRSKPLSFREKKMLERAKYLLVSEMATSRNTTAENAEATVVKSLAKAKLQFPVLTEKFE